MQCWCSLLICLLLVQRVLTAEYVDGCKVNNVAAIQAIGLSVTDVSSIFSTRYIYNSHSLR